MSTIVMADLQDRLAEALERAEQGETITITREGLPVARLGPAEQRKSREEIAQAVEEMLSWRDRCGPVLGPDLTIRDLIEEGRRS